MLSQSQGNPLPDKSSDTSTAYTAIKQLIAEGYFKPGQRLIETQVAEHLGLSRTPIRQALALVEVEGLVKSTPKKGTTVHTFTKKEVEDIYVLRNILEGFAVQQSATRAEQKDVDELRFAWQKIEDRIAGIEKWDSSDDRWKHTSYLTECSRHFHSTIVKASGNSRLDLVMKFVSEIPLTSTVYFHFTKEQIKLSNHHHKLIIEAIESKEAAAAAKVMSEHIKMALDVLLENTQFI